MAFKIRRGCNVYGTRASKTNKDARNLAAIALVSAGYAGDMPEELFNALLDDIDYYNDKVKCRKIEGDDAEG